jgi:hypothetical protein
MSFNPYENLEASISPLLGGSAFITWCTPAAEGLAWWAVSEDSGTPGIEGYA